MAEKIPSSLLPRPRSSDPHLVEWLREHGPQFTPTFYMSSLRVLGLVCGQWPMVISFQLNEPGKVSLEIVSEGPLKFFTKEFSRDPMDRRPILFYLPRELGDQVQPAYIVVNATDRSGRRTRESFEIYALGAGTRAIGSAAIDQISFYPPDIRVGLGKKAAYRFFSHKDFDLVAVEFLKLQNTPEGAQHQCIGDQEIDNGVHSQQWVGKPPDRPREWEGTDRNHQISIGHHKLRIRAWDRDHEGGWLIGLSENSVRVSK